MRIVFKIASLLLLTFSVQNVSAQQQHKYYDFWQKGTLYLGRYDTIVGITIYPDSVCQWTDSSKVEVWASIDGFHQINDGMSAYYVGTPNYAGGGWLYSNARGKLSCDSFLVLGDNPDFVVIDPFALVEAQPVAAVIINSHSQLIRMCLRDGMTLNIELFDLLGNQVLNNSINCNAGTSEIDLGMSGLAPGCYWYVVRGNGWRKSGKVMKLS